jgi:hypothetical protein
MPSIKTAAPQFLVSELSDSLDFYVEDPDGYILCFSEAT